MDLKEILGSYIKEHNMSMRELGRKCDISHQTIANLLKGTNSRGEEMVPDTTTFEKLSKGTGIPQYVLMGYENPVEFYGDLLTGIFPDDSGVRRAVQEAKGELPLQTEQERKAANEEVFMAYVAGLPDADKIRIAKKIMEMI